MSNIKRIIASYQCLWRDSLMNAMHGRQPTHFCYPYNLMYCLQCYHNISLLKYEWIGYTNRNLMNRFVTLMVTDVCFLYGQWVPIRNRSAHITHLHISKIIINLRMHACARYMRIATVYCTHFADIEQKCNWMDCAHTDRKDFLPDLIISITSIS